MDSGLTPSACPGMTARRSCPHCETSPARSCWSAPARWAAPCCEGWLALGLDPSKIAILEPQPSDDIAALQARGVRINPASIDGRERDRHRDQAAGRRDRGADAQAACRQRHRRGLDHGRQDARLSRKRAAGVAIVRAMPNTPAAIGRGITVAVPNAKCHRRSARARGPPARRGRRGRMGRRTKRCSTRSPPCPAPGPAYVFLLAESLARAGAAAGLPADLAARLARATVAGSGELLHRRRSMPRPCARTSPRRAAPRRRRSAC